MYAYEELKSEASKQLPGVDQHSLEVCSYALALQSMSCLYMHTHTLSF